MVRPKQTIEQKFSKKIYNLNKQLEDIETSVAKRTYALYALGFVFFLFVGFVLSDVYTFGEYGTYSGSTIRMNTLVDVVSKINDDITIIDSKISRLEHDSICMTTYGQVEELLKTFEESEEKSKEITESLTTERTNLIDQCYYDSLWTSGGHCSYLRTNKYVLDCCFKIFVERKPTENEYLYYIDDFDGSKLIPSKDMLVCDISVEDIEERQSEIESLKKEKEELNGYIEKIRSVRKFPNF